MNEAELRARYEERLSTTDKEVLDELWRHFETEDRDYIDYALDYPEEGIADMVGHAENNLMWWRLGLGRPKPAGREMQATVEVEITDYERECADALSSYLAKRASRLTLVRSFREEKFGRGLFRGSVLTPEQALEFLRQMALDCLPDPNTMSEIGLSQTGSIKRWWTRWWTRRLRSMDREELLQHVMPTNVSYAYLVESSFDSLYPASRMDIQGIWFPSSEDTSLGELSVRLATIFPWTPEDAAWFVLTGECPEVAPLRLSYNRRRGLYTLTFATWISEKTIRQAYAGARDLLGQGDNRPLADKTLAAFRFVTEHTDDEGNRASWPQLTRLWNEEQPNEWRFKDRFGLRKAYLRAEKVLGGPWH